MPPPAPPQPPQPPRRSNLPFLILALVIAVGALGYSRGWFTFNQGKFQADKDAAAQKAAAAWTAMKEKVNNLSNQHKNAKEAEKPDVQKQLDEAKKNQDEAESIKKEIDQTDDEKKIQELQNRLQKLLDKTKTEPKKD